MLLRIAPRDDRSTLPVLSREGGNVAGAAAWGQQQQQQQQRKGIAEAAAARGAAAQGAAAAPGAAAQGQQTPTRPQRLNVLVMFLDGVSRRHFHRKMPQTVKALERLHTSSKASLYEFFRWVPEEEGLVLGQQGQPLRALQVGPCTRNIGVGAWAWCAGV